MLRPQLLNFRAIFGKGDEIGLTRDPLFASRGNGEDASANARRLRQESIYFSLDRLSFTIELKTLITKERDGGGISLPGLNVNANVKLRASCTNIFIGYNAVRECQPMSQPADEYVNHGRCRTLRGEQGTYAYKLQRNMGEESAQCQIHSQDMYCENLKVIPSFILEHFYVRQEQLTEWVLSEYLGPLILKSFVIDPDDPESPLTAYAEDVVHWLYGAMDGDGEETMRRPQLAAAMTVENFEVSAEQRYEIPSLFAAMND